MARLDRNSASANRLRRNFQKLQSSTASTSIALNPSPNNALVTTSTGYGVFVDGSTITNANSTLSVILEPGGGLSSYPAGVGTILASTGELITFSSTGVDVALPAGSPGQVLTVLDASHTIGWSTGGSSTIIVPSTGISVSTSGASTFITNTSTGSTFFVLAGNPGISTSTNSTSTFVFNNDVFIASTGITISTSSNSTVITNTQPPGSTFFVLSGNSGICTSTSGLSTFVLNNNVFVPSTGIAISTSGNSTIITNTQLAGSTFFVLAGNTGISTSTSTSANSTSTFIFNTDVLVPSTGISLSTSGASTFITNTSTFQSTQVLPVFAGDPGSPTDGQAWYNSTASAISPRTRVGGLTEIFARGSTALTNVANSTTSTFTMASVTYPANYFNTSRRVSMGVLGSYNISTINTLAFNVIATDGVSTTTAAIRSGAIGVTTGTFFKIDANTFVLGTGAGQLALIDFLYTIIGTGDSTGIVAATLNTTLPITISFTGTLGSTLSGDAWGSFYSTSGQI